MCRNVVHQKKQKNIEIWKIVIALICPYIELSNYNITTVSLILTKIPLNFFYPKTCNENKLNQRCFIIHSGPSATKPEKLLCLWRHLLHRLWLKLLYNILWLKYFSSFVAPGPVVTKTNATNPFREQTTKGTNKRSNVTLINWGKQAKKGFQYSLFFFVCESDKMWLAWLRAFCNSYKKECNPKTMTRHGKQTYRTKNMK